LRSRFLIPSTPALNPTPIKLSAPSYPKWIENVEHEPEDKEFDGLDKADLDTAEILCG
jgi:hypothetical protein